MKLLKYLVNIPFALCVLFLQLLGKCFGLTYKQISVVFNLWIQGGVLVLSAWLPFVQSLMCLHQAQEGMWWGIMFCALCYGLLYWTVFVLVMRHYHLPFNRAFDLCVDDLLRIASIWKCSYYAVNIIIFVIMFLLLLGLNLLLAWLLPSLLIS